MPYKPWHFFANTKARMVAGLKSMVFGDTNKTEVKVGTDDPSVTAQNMPKGSYYFRTDTPQMWQKQDDGSTTNFRLLTPQEFTLEPTGFVDPAGIGVSYDATTGRITLTHATSIQFLLKGRLYTRTSPWVVTDDLSQSGTPVTVPGAPTPANGRYFLYADPATATAAWAGSPWTFDKLQIALVFKNATAHFALREVHGLMQYQSHQENHQVNGTYVSSAINMTTGTAFTATTSATATTASNCPGIDGGTINDEDIPTTNNAWPEANYTVNTYNSGVYTTAYRNGGSGVITFSTVAQLPYITAGGAPGALQYNPVTAGVGALATVTENSWMNVLVVALPVTSDTESQKFRYIFLQGQQQFTTLAAAQIQDPKSWDFGELTSSIPEGVAIQMYSYQYNAAGGDATPAGVLGRAFLGALPVVFTGSRGTLTGFTGVAPSDHQTLSNRSAADAHPDSSISATGPFTGTLSGVTTVAAALTTLDGLKTLLTTAAVRASGSGGLELQNNSGNDVLLLGAGGGLGATFYDGVNVTGVLDQAAAATLEIGKSNATAINLGKTGVTTTSVGPFTSSELLTASVGVTVGTGTPAANRITLASSAMRVGGGTTAGGSLDAGTTAVISWTSTSVTLAQATTVGALAGTTAHVLQASPTSGNTVQIIGNGTAGTYLGITELAIQSYYLGMDDGSTILKIRPTSTATASIVEATSAGAWTWGSTSGNVAHQIIGKEAAVGTDGGEILRFQARNTSTTTNKAALLIGGYSTGAGTAYAWIGTYENGVGPAGLKFASYTTEVGGYSSAGAWTWGVDNTNQMHYARGDLYIGNTTPTTDVTRTVGVVGNNSSTTRTGTAAGAEIYLQNKNTTANVWTGLSCISQAGRYVARIAMITENNSTDAGAMEFFTRPASGSLTLAHTIASTGANTIGPASKVGSNDFTGNLIVGATDGVAQATGYVGESVSDSGTSIITGGGGSYSASTDCSISVTAGIWEFKAVCGGYRGSTGGSGSVNGTYAIVDDLGGVIASTTMPLLAAGSSTSVTLVIVGVQAYSATRTVRVACQYGTTGSPTGAFADVRPDTICTTTLIATRIA